jgi:hypothetical protein
MHRNLLFSIFLVFVITQAYGQDKGYIAISAGPSFPNGDFGSKDIDNESAGLANTGTIVDLTFAQKFGKNLGLTVLLRGQANDIDAEPLLEELLAQYPTSFWTAEGNGWGIGGLMAGLYGSFPIGEGKLSFESRGMVGIVNATSPEITLTGFAGSQILWVKLNSATATDFAYLLGVGFKFNIGKRLGLFANFDYLGSSPEFEDVETTTSLGVYSTDTFTQTFGTVNVGIGIGYRW